MTSKRDLKPYADSARPKLNYLDRVSQRQCIQCRNDAECPLHKHDNFKKAYYQRARMRSTSLLLLTTKRQSCDYPRAEFFKMSTGCEEAHHLKQTRLEEMLSL